MRALDVHNPANPMELGFYDTYTANPDTVPGPFGGCWGVYPYFPSGKIIASDMQSGLFVFTFDYLLPRKQVHLLEPPDSTLNSFQFRWTSAGNQEEDPFSYELVILGNGFETSVRCNDTTIFLNLDTTLPADGWYKWYVKVNDEFTEVVSAETLNFQYIAPLSVKEINERPSSSSLLQNYPNPFNPLTKISFTLQKATTVTLKVFNLLGEEIRTLFSREPLTSGNHEVAFQASDLPSGIYYYRLTTPEFSETRQMILSK
jgi:hypothetical protein